jgi:hypothetical protein
MEGDPSESRVVRELRELAENAGREAGLGELYAPDGPVGPFRLRELIPWRRFTIDTGWSVEDSARALGELVGTRRLLRMLDTPFEGFREGDRFRFYETSRTRSGWIVIYAAIESASHGGATVHVLMRMQWPLLVFAPTMTVACTFAAVIIAFLGLVRGTVVGFAALLMPLCCIALFGGTFSYFSRRAEVGLRQVFPPASPELGPYREPPPDVT